MKNKLMLRLCLMMIAWLSLNSCRQDILHEQETYHNTSAFQLSSKRISLNEAKHKAELIPEIEQIETGFKKNKTNAFGKTVNYGNGVAIDTENVIYIENGPNYHTYTFNVIRENAPVDAPLENLILSPLTDGTYRELIFTYHITPAEKQSIADGIPVNTEGKVSVTELAQGTLGNYAQTNAASCSWTETTVWVTCSEGIHGASNYQDCFFLTHPQQGSPPRAYVVKDYKCFLEPDNGGSPGYVGGTPPPNGGGGPNDTEETPCNGNGVLTAPQQPGFISSEGCSGIPSQPNSSNTQIPCEKIVIENNLAKTYYNKTKFQGRLTEIKQNIAANPQEKSFSFGMKNGLEQVSSVITGVSGESVGILAQSSDPAFIVHGGVHTHTPGTADEVSPPSFSDVYAFLMAHNGNPDTGSSGNTNFKYYYTITHDGNEYVFTITNPTAFSNFMNLYPPDEYIDPDTNGWNATGSIGKDADLVMDFFMVKQSKTANESFENALAFILNKYNSGMGVSKRDTSGNFKPIFVNELTDPLDPSKKIYQKTDNCNLK